MSQETIELECRGPSDFWFAMVDLKVIRDRVLSPCDKAVYSVVCSHVDTRTRTCPLKVATIAEEANCSVRSVQESLKNLEKRGVLARRERYEDGKQKASVYKIVGHCAECYAEPRGAESAPLSSPEGCKICTPGDAEDDTPPLLNEPAARKEDAESASPPLPEGCKICAPRGAENDTPSLRESKTYEKKNKILPPSEGPAKPAAAEAGESHRDPRQLAPSPGPLYPISAAAPAMRQTAEYLLLKSGRAERGLIAKEIDALRALDVAHCPAVVQKWVCIAVERFKRLGRDPTTLTFCYVADAMRNLRPTRTLNRRPAARASPASARDDLSDLTAWAESCSSPESVAALLECGVAGK
jgi:hypothetical protein